MGAVKNLMVRGGADFSGMFKGFQSAEKSIQSFKKTASGFDKSFTKSTKTAKGFQTQTFSLSRGAKGAASGISSFIKAGLGIAGVTAGVAGLAAGAKKAFDGFLSLESSVMRTSDIFGSAQSKIAQFAGSTAKTLGMSESTAYQYAATYGNLFKGITKDVSENAGVTSAMMRASAVISSKTGRTMEDTNERIRSGILGSNEAIEDLGVSVLVSMLKTTKAFKQIANGRAWESLTYQEQQQIRVMAILEQAQTNYGNTVQKNSAFAMSSLSESFKDLAAYAGQFVNAGLQPIIKALTQVVQAATAGLKSLSAMFGLKIDTGSTKGTEAQTTAQAGLTDELEETAKAQQKLLGLDEINTAGSATASNAAGAGSVFAGLGGGEASMTAPDTSWIGGTQSKLAGFAKTISELFAPSISAWGSAFSKLKGPTEAALKTVGSSLSGLWNNTLAPLGSYIGKDFIPSVTNAFSTTFAPMFEQAMPVVIDQFAQDFQFAMGMIDRTVKDLFMPSLELAKKVAVDLFGGIKTAWDNHGAGILDGFVKFKEGVRKIWTSLYDNVFRPVFKYIGDTANWLWDKHLKPLWDNISDFVGSVAEFVFALWNQGIAPFLDFIVKTFGPAFSFVFGMIGDVIGTVFGFIADVVGGIFKALSGLLDFLTGVFTGNWEKAWGGLKKFFGGIWDALWGIVKGIVNLIIDGLNLLWGGIYLVAKGVVDFVGGISGAIGKIFGKDWSFSMPASVPKIPKLADGGLAYGRTMAEVGEYVGASSNPEVIAPFDKLEEMLQGLGGGDINLTEKIYLSDGTLVDSFSRRISRKGNQGGMQVIPAM